MTSRWRTLLLLTLAIALVAAQPAAAESIEDERCDIENAAAPAPATEASGGGSKKRKGGVKKKQVKTKNVTLQPDPQSANKVVNLGDDRQLEEVTLRVNVSPEVPPNFEKQLTVVAEPFASSSETGETVTFSEEPTFSELEVSGNRKRITFTMCVDPPDDLPAGKYTSTVMLEGPPPPEGGVAEATVTEEAVMTVTFNGKDGRGFLFAALITASLAFLILLYKGAGERRPLLLKEAEKRTDSQRDKAIGDAQGWWKPAKDCLGDMGWLVPTLASIAAAFALLYAAYDANPAWGEGGIVTNAIALIGTGLAAVGAKTVFTQSSSTTR
ncbi:MAG TPA: hypothetical protein VF255_03445 [Solirubrobacterales bacterium]